MLKSKILCSFCTLVSCFCFANENLNSTLWMQTSAEYKANSMQTYQMALTQLKSLVAEKSLSADVDQIAGFQNLPPVVILDVDETVLDNSPYQAHVILKNIPNNLENWDHWLSLKQAGAIPGAVDFIKAAKKMGVAVKLVTNRQCKLRKNPSKMSADSSCIQELETIENLAAIGLPGFTKNDLLLKNERPEWPSEKQSRRAHIAKDYRIVMLIGDDLGDFIPHAKKNISLRERDELVKKYSEKWGREWFMLTNPTYGSWERLLKPEKEKFLSGYRKK